MVQKNKEQPSKYQHTYSSFDKKKVTWNKIDIPKYKRLTDEALRHAAVFWKDPEATPLLCVLFSELLVKCADLSSETSLEKSTNRMERKSQKKSRNLSKEETVLIKRFKEWKAAGKPRSRSNPIRISYVSARSNFQRARRYKDNLSFIFTNNELMRAEMSDRNIIYRKMKKLRGKTAHIKPSYLDTPVGVYHGEDILEGFAADAEHLGRERGESSQYDNEFYRLCKLDNVYIFEIEENEQLKIPPMTIEDLEEILFKRMKPGKACDIYQLTVEHLREAGKELCILNLLNTVISDIQHLACPQIKTGLATSVHKGKRKPLEASKSYRRITVTPQIGAILDRYIDPVTEKLFRSTQSPDQLGFTQHISYLMAAIQRGECQRWAQDNKMTCFGVSLDGEAAFPSVDREIQVRELYSVGERGDYLGYSRNGM